MKAFGGMFLQRSSSFLCVPLRKSPLSPLIQAASQHVVAVALCMENAVSCAIGENMFHNLPHFFSYGLFPYAVGIDDKSLVCSWWGTRW